MKLHNEFTVPLPPRAAFDLLNQVERVAPCFPGAKLLEARDDGSYRGSVSLRLGPVALSFEGTATYEEVDAEALTVRAKANGNEKRARGTARADVGFAVVEDPAGSRVLIDTDLQLVGSIAQYARGGSMIETTAQVMIDDFAKNLQAQLAAEPETAGAPAGSGPGPATTAPHGSEAAPAETAPKARPAAAPSAPPSILRILWLALKRRLFGAGS